VRRIELVIGAKPSDVLLGILFIYPYP